MQNIIKLNRVLPKNNLFPFVKQISHTYSSSSSSSSSSPNNNINNDQLKEIQKNNFIHSSKLTKIKLKKNQKISISDILRENSLLDKDINEQIIELLKKGLVREAIKCFYNFLGKYHDYKMIKFETFYMILEKALNYQPKETEINQDHQEEGGIKLLTVLLRDYTRYFKGKKEEEIIQFFKLFQGTELNSLIVNNDDFWFDFLTAYDEKYLKIMESFLPESKYKSSEYYNFWLERLSSSDRTLSDFYELVWELFKYMDDKNMEIKRSSLDAFELYLFKNNKDLTLEQFQLINKMELAQQSSNNDDSKSYIFTDLKIKLKYFPNNDFEQFNENRFNRDDILNTMDYIKNRDLNDTSITSVALYVNLASRVYTVVPIDVMKKNQKGFKIQSYYKASGIKRWGEILSDRNIKNDRNFIRRNIELVLSICLSLKRQNRIEELKQYIIDNYNIFDQLGQRNVMMVISAFPPTGQANFIQSLLKNYSNYYSFFVDFCIDLKSKLPDPSLFPKLDKIISNQKIEKSPNDFIKLFKEIYINK